ncbi:MAG: hypothetical protein NC926_10260 [Candidatus Omnitrophica bacterium]|nr:hypothetical protein [Candidatus Omnitrophota bacterium]
MEKMEWGMGDVPIIMDNCTCTCKCGGGGDPQLQSGDDPVVCKPSPWGVVKAAGLAAGTYFD